MKLFGNSNNAARTEKSRRQQTPPDRNKSKDSGIGRGRTALLIILGVLLAVLLTAGIFINAYVRPPVHLNSPVSDTAIDPDTALPFEREEGSQSTEQNGVYTILLAGTDRDGFRTDTIMLACLNTNRHRVSLISIPRDTIVETIDGVSKINSVFGTYGGGKEGMEALMLEVEDILGILPTGYVLVDLNAFVSLVDTVGGVEFYVPQDMHYDDPTQDLYIHLPKGYHHLDGKKAIQLVRYRSYAQADIQRTKVQQDFMRAVVSKCLSVESLGKIRDYCEIFDKNVLTNFSLGNLLFFAQELAKCDLSAAESETLPGSSVWVGDAACYRLNESEVTEIIKHHTEP